MIPAVPGPQNHALNRLPSIAGWRRGQGVLCFLGGQGFSAISLRRKGGTVMQKTYVLDTNVLIQSPEALEAFEDNHIVLPLAVLEELDGLKNAEGEKGRSARQVIRFLEELRSQGSLVEGVSLPGGGTLRLEVNHVGVRLPDGMDPASRDNRILKVCRGLWEDGTPAVLVTKDIVARIKAQMMGIPAEDFRADRIPEEQPYTGRREV